MAELNQNKKLQQPFWTDAVWKLYFTLKIDYIQSNYLLVFYKIVVLKYKKIYKRPQISFFSMFSTYFL